MSIYKACSSACRELAKTGEPFIDIDVVNAAAQDGWSDRNYREAQRQANQIVGTDYRAGKLVRYGPVTFEGNKDYVRKAGRVLYADAEAGPKTIETPNGKFKQISDRSDDLARVGRRQGTRRDDFTAWDQQSPEAIRSDSMLVDGRPLERRIHQLEAELRAATKRCDELEVENQRMREAKAGEMVPIAPDRKQIDEAVLEALAALELDSRIKTLEDREESRARMYAA